MNSYYANNQTSNSIIPYDIINKKKFNFNFYHTIFPFIKYSIKLTIDVNIAIKVVVYYAISTGTFQFSNNGINNTAPPIPNIEANKPHITPYIAIFLAILAFH